LNLDSPGNLPEPERDEIASRLLARGHDPTIAYELTQEGVSEANRMLDQQELIEGKFSWLRLHNVISMLVSKLGQRKQKQLPLLLNGLPRDPARVKGLKIERLKEEWGKLASSLSSILIKIKLAMNRENSEDQLANLENTKARIEEELKQKQEEINRLQR